MDIGKNFKLEGVDGVMVVFFSLVGLGFELRAMDLQSRCSTTPPVHFALVF
jgi:hypothetical protein